MHVHPSRVHRSWRTKKVNLCRSPRFVLQVSWSPDSTQLISASGDKTVKLWDVGAGTAVTTFKMGTDVNDQQLGCLWQKDHLLSISLSGYINYLDKNNPERPIRTIKVRMPPMLQDAPPNICHSLKCCFIFSFK